MAQSKNFWLVETEWLAERLSAPDLVVVDATLHFPGSGQNAQQEFMQTTVHPLELEKSNGEGTHFFTGTFTCSESGSHGYTLRVVPSHRDLQGPLEMGLIRWAEA